MRTLPIGSVLAVVSSATALALVDGTMMPTGYWAGEFLLPYQALTRAGHRVVVATPGGLLPTPDPVSLGAEPADLLARLAAIPELQAPWRLEEVDPAGMRALVLPGGYAPMADLAASPALGGILRHAHAAGLPIAAICHAPAALLAAREPGRPWCFAGFRMAVFTDAEEAEWLGGRRLPWLAEDALTAAGALCQPAANWASQVVRDRNLLTAQNSPSCSEFTRQLLAMLG